MPSRRNVGEAIAAAVLAMGAVAAGLVGSALRGSGGTPEEGLGKVLLPVLVWCLALAVAGLLQRRLRGSILGVSLLGAFVAVSAVLAIYASWVESLVRFPADILLWSEGPFVQDIVHLRTGQPLYGEPDAMASLVYPPLTQLATYGLAKVLGAATSIPVYRTIQLGWLALASAIGVLAAAELLALAERNRDSLLARHHVLAGAFGAVFLFLVATNSITNPFAHNLHNDSLATFISAVVFWQLARYARVRSTKSLVVLSVLPVIGFLVKQSLAIWAPMIALAILLLGGEGSFRRAVYAGGVALGLIAIVNLVAPSVWGDGWSWWVFGIVRTERVVPVRSLFHVAETWIFPALLIGAGFVLIRSARQRAIVVLWLMTLGLYLVEVYTSGVAWMLNHMAPVSLLIGIWAVAALFGVWPQVVTGAEASLGGTLLRAGRGLAMTALVALLVAGVGAVRKPERGLPNDANRYRADIERSVGEVLDAHGRVLLDHGSWVFVSRGISVGDRSAAIGDVGGAGKSEFRGTLERIRTNYYDRILVRDLDSPGFFYDHFLWRRSSGIRAALHEHYRVVGAIPAVRGDVPNVFFHEISILEPRSVAQREDRGSSIGGPSMLKPDSARRVR